MPLIAFDNYCLKRGRRVLAERLDCRVVGGQWLELVGPNGSGKSSLLRALISERDTPSLQVQGHIGLYAPPFGLRDELRVDEQLAHSSQAAFALSVDERQAVLELVGLGDLFDELVSRLSQGQRARLGMAQLLASRADIWLMDEPLNTLDAQALQMVGQLIHSHCAQGGIAVVATHRVLAQVYPPLADVMAAQLRLVDGVGQCDAHAFADGPLDGSAQTSSMSGDADYRWVDTLRWVIRREFTLQKASPKHIVWPVVFHALIMSMFPFVLGADSGLLTQVAPGLIWISALLSMVLGADALFQSDFAAGWLLQAKAQRVPLTLVCLGKMAFTGGLQVASLCLASSVLAIQFALDGAVFWWLLLALAVGMCVLSLLGAVFSAMTLIARQATLVVYLMAMPLFVPVLIFGSAITNAVRDGFSPMSSVWVLCALLVLSVMVIPVMTGRLLSWMLE